MHRERRRRTPCYDFFAFPAPAGYSTNSASLVGRRRRRHGLVNLTPQAKAFMKYIARAQPGEIWAHARRLHVAV